MSKGLILVLIILGIVLIVGIYYFNQQAIKRRELEAKEMRLKGIAEWEPPKGGIGAMLENVGTLLLGEQ